MELALLCGARVFLTVRDDLSGEIATFSSESEAGRKELIDHAFDDEDCNYTKEQVMTAALFGCNST